MGGGRPPRLVGEDRVATDADNVPVAEDELTLFVGQGLTSLREIADENVAAVVPVIEDGIMLGDTDVEAGADANVPVPGEVVAE